ncbi:MAG: hypothetical protein RL417_1690 [Pseudomonadota bacterium]|jgi:alpha-glucosidase
MNQTKELYPEPRSIFSPSVTATVVGPNQVNLSTDVGVPCEIEFIEGVGWALEVRYDQLGGERWRQPFTGEQAACERATIALEESAESFLMRAGEQVLSFDRRTGGLSLADGEGVFWQSSRSPFYAHPEGVEILDEIQSIEHPGFEEQTPWRPVPIYLKTTMARFRYPAPNGAILGLPGQTGEFNRKGYRYELFNNDQSAHVPSRPPMYQSWPIVIHRGLEGRGWVGIFHDNPARTFVDLGDFYKDTVLFESIGNNTRVYVVYAETLAGVTARFVRLLGTPVFPPAWAFGYQQCRYSYMSTTEIRRVARRFRETRIPCDALYFDIDHMEGYRVFTHDSTSFGDMRECLDDLHAEGFKAVCIVDPGVKIDRGYPVYERLKAADAFLKDGVGEEFEIVCWPGKAALPDFFSTEAAGLWVELQREWLDRFPFDGIWNDMNEPSNFDGGRHKTTTAVSREGPLTPRYNLYGLKMAEASATGWQAVHPDTRGVVISRSGYPGVQKHAVIWHGDNHAWWEHLRLAVDTAVSYSLCGAFYTGPDVPGFFGNPTDDLAVRFFQLGAFLPLFRGHSYKLSSSKEPYAFAGEAARRIKAAIELRYSLISEWYSNFERCIRLGHPPLEPVFGDDGAPVRDSFLLFDKLLVNAITTRDERMRSIWLPEGVWYRLGDTHTPIEGGRWIQERISLESLPVFVRAGAVLIRNMVGCNVAETAALPERYEIYPDSARGAVGYRYRFDGNLVSPAGSRAFKLVVAPGEQQVHEVEESR